jgi:hypothetical protein
VGGSHRQAGRPSHGLARRVPGVPRAGPHAGGRPGPGPGPGRVMGATLVRLRHSSSQSLPRSLPRQKTALQVGLRRRAAVIDGHRRHGDCGRCSKRSPQAAVTQPGTVPPPRSRSPSPVSAPCPSRIRTMPITYPHHAHHGSRAVAAPGGRPPRRRTFPATAAAAGGPRLLSAAVRRGARPGGDR